MAWAWLKWLMTPQRRPLSAMRPESAVSDDATLGLEATDMRLVEEVARRNQALDRTNGFRLGQQSRLNSFAQNADAKTAVDLGQDETYARRFHSAFLKSKDKAR